MLNPNLDSDHLRVDFARNHRLQIEDLLVPEAAEALHDCLANQVRWDLAYHKGTTGATLSKAVFESMGPGDRAAFMQNIHQTARDGYQFAYNTYLMVTAYREQRDPTLYLHRATEFLNSSECLKFIRGITGVDKIIRANAQATRYMPGHFLKQHTDNDAERGRELAYVISLTKNWQAHWGGLLHFMDGEGRVIDTFVPRFNTLSLFLVPTPHCVSLVAPFATSSRYSITGWFLSC
ncbi:MAG TPA: 2OG-Fe(II) oxygenase family protein [Gammaproteobacteria bacterium]|nr:2OG-Fe(II) oxygenase family protein [Gammaproteobacteria bacterium]